MTQMNGRKGPSQSKGFAALSPERRREVSSMGGRTSAECGRGHRWTPEEARKAGLLGGRGRKKGGQG